ncbi:transmembrane protease serine 9 [Harpegnathos saltator]|nr:transmembrane protease serine 9 [Harpegnathos saltator]
MLLQSLLATVLVFQACLAGPLSLDPRITDGSDAMPGEFPHQVSIQWGFPPFISYQHTCGGSILDEKTILTAAHCIPEFGVLKIIAGKYFLDIEEDSNQESLVNRIKVHEGFKGDISQHDIAILKLATPLVYNEKVSAIQLPPQGELETGDALLSGWGSISKDFLPVLPAVLQKVTVPVLDNVSCLKRFPNNIIGKQPELFDTQICTDSTKGESACSGDSGGPLVQVVDKVTKQIGIVSWGIYPCGANLMPSVYTRVSSYTDWINKNREFAAREYRSSSNIEMSLKAIIVFALLAVAFAEKPYLGFRLPDLTQVVGGNEAKEHGYPYIVSMQWAGSHLCAGSILNQRWILTAGHCVQAVPGVDQLGIKAGKHNLRIIENSEQSIKVVATYVHENYRGGVGPFDIALMKLAKDLTFTKEVQPIALPEKNSEPTGDAILCGWGSTSKTIVPNMPDKLQDAKLPIVDRQSCDNAVRRLTGSSPVHETNVCTGPLETGGFSACSGDSGGPLAQKNSDGSSTIIGIVSWGIIPCGTRGAPSVYARPSLFNDWIAQIMKNN